jgi:hypothetical protein
MHFCGILPECIWARPRRDLGDLGLNLPVDYAENSRLHVETSNLFLSYPASCLDHTNALGDGEGPSFRVIAALSWEPSGGGETP